MTLAPTKRLFFGMEVHAPWPEALPSGRLLDPEHRHLTLVFLGNTPYQKLLENLQNFPIPTFKVGLCGTFDQCLFLPPRHPHVVAWNVQWLENPSPLFEFQKTLVEWLKEQSFQVEERHPFTPHVTITRPPFEIKEWKKSFIPLPCFASSIHLFESLGHSQYHSLWKYPIHLPFEEIEHTADIAFWIYGENMQQLFQHAQIALVFTYPLLLPFLIPDSPCNSLEELIISLNEIVSLADQEMGAPFKAISFHGDVQKTNNLLKWEMIIDV